MRLFRSDTETNLASYILDELRELRKGQEGNNVEIRGEFASVRDTITTLSDGVKVTQSDTDTLKHDLEQISARVAVTEDHIQNINKKTTIKEVKQSSSWDGPKKILTVLGLIATFFAAVITVSKGWPVLVSVLGTTVQ